MGGPFESCQQHAEMYWYHTEINGLPEKVTDSRGEIVWHGTSTAWGRSQRGSVYAEWDVPQNLRFQGQYLDRETGLHYNTFRYYDPTGGCYTQMDPIGLAGGLNTYTYVVDPLVWVDPLGLAGCSTTLGKNMMASMELPRSTSWKGYQAHHIIPKQLADHPALKKLNYYIDDAQNGIFLRKADGATSAMSRHQGNHHGYTDAIKDALDRIDLNQSTTTIANQVNDIQNTARRAMENGVPIRSKDMYNSDIFGSDNAMIGRARVYDIWTNILR